MPYDRKDNGDRGDRQDRRQGSRKAHKKVCNFCVSKAESIDYKDVACCGSTLPSARRSCPGV